MSKSDETSKGIIFLGDEPEVARQKIMNATTDNYGAVQYDLSKQPGISSLLEVLALLRDKPIQEVARQYAGRASYGEFKSEIADEVANFLTAFQTQLASVNEEQMLDKLTRSETAMNQVASQTLMRVQQAVGLR